MLSKASYLLTTKNSEIIKISDIFPYINLKSQRDLTIYNLKTDSKFHLNLLFHHTIVEIFERKISNPNSIIVIDQADFNLPAKTNIKYKNFINQLSKLLPIYVVKETHLDSISNKILMKVAKKATNNNNINFYKLKKFSIKHGLKDVMNSYLENPSLKYIISI